MIGAAPAKTTMFQTHCSLTVQSLRHVDAAHSVNPHADPAGATARVAAAPLSTACSLMSLERVEPVAPQLGLKAYFSMPNGRRQTLECRTACRSIDPTSPSLSPRRRSERSG